uniref:ABC transporter n=1 Tax=Prochloron didemni P3-Solomon TaxID=910458 RepID=G0XS89_PRODI|nr:ABC transporter [Prochloron didemni P3-Solomon]
MLFLLRTFWASILLATVASFLSGMSSTALVAIISTTATNTGANISSFVWSFVYLCLLLVVSNFASQALSVRLCEKAILKLRMLLSQQILFTPLKRLEEISIPGLLAILTDDIQSVSEALSKFAFLCTNLAIILSCFAYLIWLSPLVFLFMLVLFVVGMIVFWLLTNKGRRFLSLAREEQDVLFKQFRALTEGTKELKMNYQNQKTFLFKDLQKVASNSSNYKIAGHSLFSVATSWALMIIFAAIGCVIFVLPDLARIDLSIIAKYAFITIYLVAPLDAVMAIIPEFSKAIIALKRMETISSSFSVSFNKKKNNHQIITYKTNWSRLELRKVTYSYYDDSCENSFQLGPIDLTLRPGELVFLIGGNGSGKSTLVKLITGLYFPDEGEIYLDGLLIDEQNRQWYREHFSVVFSDFYLFERLMSWKDDSFDAQAKDYLSKLKLDHKVQIRDGWLSTTNLSQGQRKRLSLLNVYLENRSIYIFDEWAADQDPLFKEIFYVQFLSELKNRGKAVLVITHDDRYFDLADRVIRLDYGQISVRN